MTFLASIVSGAGKLRTEYKLAQSKQPQLTITCSDAARAELIKARSLDITTLALAGSLQVGLAAPCHSASFSIVVMAARRIFFFFLGCAGL